mgnify:CR=1 FL=1
MQKLYSLEAEQATKPLLVLLVAKLMNVEGIEDVVISEDQDFLRRTKSVTGRYPVLETADGVTIADSLPIARYLAKDCAAFVGATAESSK